MTPLVIFLAIAFAIAGWAIAKQEGHPVWGAAMGLLLGPVGVAVVLINFLVVRAREQRLRK